MHGFALAFLGLALGAEPVELPKDVYEIGERRFVMPVKFDPDRLGEIKRVRVYVSEDRGATWKHVKDVKSGDKGVELTAPRDGHYWFALQVVLKDGTSDPADLDNLAPTMKVYVNAERRALKVWKSDEDRRREVEDLRKTVELLQKRVRELEAERKPR